MKTTIRQVILLGSIIVLVMMSFLSTPRQVHAQSVMVVNTTDDVFDDTNTTLCSLREAIVAANENKPHGGCPAGSVGKDTIRLMATTTSSSQVVYELTRTGAFEDAGLTGDLDILDAVDIIGPGLNAAAIDGQSIDRVFHIKTNAGVNISGVTITGGNTSANGGGIYVDHSSNIKLSNVKVTKNYAGTAGGGIGISRGSSNITVELSEISYNTSDFGGGIYNEGSFILNSSLVIDNTGSTSGGAIDNNSQDVGGGANITNTTISRNHSQTAAGVSNSATLYLLNNTIVDNFGTGLEIKQNGSGWVKNTIIARQVESRPNCFINLPSTFVSAGYNIETLNTCNFNQAGDQANVTEAGLGLANALSNNGGPTQTYALIAPSAAINTGNDASCPAYDQRGYSRGVGRGSRCDVGAFEGEAVPLALHVYLPLLKR